MLNSVSADRCQELGTSACPCVLANINECLVCSHLQGKDICDCDWENICVYLDYSFDKKAFQMPKGKKECYQVIKSLTISNDTYLFFLLVSEDLLEKVTPFAKVMVWPNLRPQNQRHPAVVLKTYKEQGILVLGVELSGYNEKLTYLGSKELAVEVSREQVITSLEHLIKLANQKILFNCGGFGQLLLTFLLAEYSLAKNNTILIYLDTPIPWAMKRLKKLGITFYTDKTTALKQLIADEKPSYCCSLGNYTNHKEVAYILANLKLSIPLIINISDY